MRGARSWQRAADFGGRCGSRALRVQQARAPVPRNCRYSKCSVPNSGLMEQVNRLIALERSSSRVTNGLLRDQRERDGQESQQ